MKKCFVISPIGDEGSETRRRSDQILKHIISPAVQSCGYDAIRADKISEPGIISSQVIQHIVDDPLVVGDLTGMNPNVFYELAIRHAIRKPLVQIIQKGEKIPFDIAGMRTIFVDHTDLDSVDEAKAEIEKQVKAVEGKGPNEIESPISVSVELQSLRQSDRPQDRSFAEVLSNLSSLRSEIATNTSAIERKLSEITNLPALTLDTSRRVGSIVPALREILDKLNFLDQTLDVDPVDLGTVRDIVQRLEYRVKGMMSEFKSF